MPTSLTRQHFKALAAAVAGVEGLTPYQRLRVAEEIATAVRPFNQRFDRDKFLAVATTVHST